MVKILAISPMLYCIDMRNQRQGDDHLGPALITNFILSAGYYLLPFIYLITIVSIIASCSAL